MVMINKESFLKKKHMDKFNNIDIVFDELYQIINDRMSLTSLYIVKDNKEFINELSGCEKYIICFISDKNDINKIIEQMMADGNYINGYLLNEMATEVIFNSSEELKKAIKEKVEKKGYILKNLLIPGERGIELKYQKTLLDILKKEVNINAEVTQGYMIVPEKSLLYLIGIDKNGIYNEGCEPLTKNNCFYCDNINCEYREKDE